MITKTFLAGVAACAIVAATAAEAQDATRLPEVVAEAERTPPAYEAGRTVDGGTIRIGQTEVRDRTPGSGDVNQLLKLLPTVQFSRTEFLATRENIQDLRPADISISGGRIYDNLFTLDGVDVSSRLDTSKGNPSQLNELVGASAQSLWLDANLIGAVTLRDSNVSAEFGRFTGGALNIETRDPRASFGGSATVSHTSDALTSFKLSDGSRRGLDGDVPDRPAFEKIRYGVTLDVPLSSDVSALLAVNRSQANVTYFRGANYGRRPFGQRSRSDNVMGKITASLDAVTTLSGQVAYTPYSSEFSNANGIDNLIVTQGGGVTGNVMLARKGVVDWSLRGSIAHSDSGRDAADLQYLIPSNTPNGAVCTNTTCVRGGFGDLTQQQTNYALTFRASTAAGAGTLSGGIDAQRIDALRERPTDGAAYQTPVSGTNITCATGDSLACVTGQYALTQRQLYRAFRADVSLDSLSGWAEYRADIGPFDLRGGLRYDYESFLGNHNVSPRLSAAYTLPGTEWSLTLGANRYFGRSMLAYALRAQYPDNITQQRVPTVSGGRRIYTDNWTISRASRPEIYSNLGSLRTPRSDELSATLSAPILGGTLRLRGIHRRGEDEFTRSIAERVTTTLANGITAISQSYRLTNDGFSRYRGGTIEWQRSFGRHTVALNTSFSKTSTSNDDYLADADDLIDDTPVVFEGKVVSLSQVILLSSREDFASPFIVNGSWNARWWRERITTNLNLRYRDPFRVIQDTGRNVRVDGTTYDEYAFVRVPASIDANLNVQAELLRNRIGALTLDLRIANLFDSIPVRNATAIAQPWQYGRSAWTGLTFRF